MHVLSTIHHQNDRSHSDVDEHMGYKVSLFISSWILCFLWGSNTSVWDNEVFDNIIMMFLRENNKSEAQSIAVGSIWSILTSVTRIEDWFIGGDEFGPIWLEVSHENPLKCLFWECYVPWHMDGKYSLTRHRCHCSRCSTFGISGRIRHLRGISRLAKWRLPLTHSLTRAVPCRAVGEKKCKNMSRILLVNWWPSCHDLRIEFKLWCSIYLARIPIIQFWWENMSGKYHSERWRRRLMSPSWHPVR